MENTARYRVSGYLRDDSHLATLHDCTTQEAITYAYDHCEQTGGDAHIVKNGTIGGLFIARPRDVQGLTREEIVEKVTKLLATWEWR